MKILRKGTLPRNIIYTGTCIHCNAQVEATYTEVSRRDLGDRYSGEFIECSIPCPTEGCGRKILMLEKPTPASEMDKVFKELFADPQPTRSSNKDLLKAFKEAFGEGPTPKEEKVRITLPRLPECHKTGRVYKELLKRMKKLPGVREKTLNDLCDELLDD